MAAESCFHCDRSVARSNGYFKSGAVQVPYCCADRDNGLQLPELQA